MKIIFGNSSVTAVLLILSSVVDAKDKFSTEYLFSLSLEELSRIEVGSHIKGAFIGSTLPITLLNAEDIEITGASSGEELLRAIPQFGAIGFGDSRAGITGVNADRSDVASINLRSLGEGNTLVLLNGRRMVLHPITQNSSVDRVPVVSYNANTLPVTSLERIEILRDGAGALYGSDAVAGVVNYELKKDYIGSELSLRYGAESDTNRDNISLNGNRGFLFNSSATHVFISGSYAGKNDAKAREKDYASHQDLRPLAPEFAADTSLDRRSTLEVFPLLNYTGLGLFHLRPVNLTRDNGQLWSLADCGGLGLDGSTTVINDGTEDLCLDTDGQDRAIRPNRNEVRTLTPEVERYNFFAYLNHELGSGHELYGEATYYSSTAKRQWEQASILSNGQFFIPADYYYNPFGPVNFADGRPNPNRLPGLDPGIVPLEGLGFELQSMRPVDVGTRNVKVDSTSYRILAGLQGTWGADFEDIWQYDTAALYSKAEVKDISTNRISTPLLQAQLSLDTPDAYNIFTGVNPANPVSINDLTINPRSSINPFITSTSRHASTSLSLVDFKLSNVSWLNLPAGEVALGMGAEWRQEELDEDNSGIFDGSQPFIDALDPNLTAGEITNFSSLQGSSYRPDVSGHRTVISAYAELIVPLLQGLPGAQRLDMQVAMRYEDFSDVGDIARPKLALSWYPLHWFQVRGAFSQGFRAPNLMQLNLPAMSITADVRDYAEGIVEGTGDINNGPGNGNYVLATSGNPNLKPEKSDNTSLGIVFSFIPELLMTLDWWEIKTNNTVGVFSDANESRRDALLRAQGSFNPNVIRAAPDANNPLGKIILINRQYESLNTRRVEGLDLSINYGFEPFLGSFEVKLNAAHIITFDQTPSSKAQRLVDFGADESVLGSSAGSLVKQEFIPEWRGSFAINWNSNNRHWGAGFFANYIGDVVEPSVTNKDKQFPVDEDVRINISGVHRGLLGDGSTIRLGINNLFDKDPPLAVEDFGFEGELHSSYARFFYMGITMQFN